MDPSAKKLDEVIVNRTGNEGEKKELWILCRRRSRRRNELGTSRKCWVGLSKVGFLVWIFEDLERLKCGNHVYIRGRLLCLEMMKPLVFVDGSPCWEYCCFGAI